MRYLSELWKSLKLKETDVYWKSMNLGSQMHIMRNIRGLVLLPEGTYYDGFNKFFGLYLTK